MWQILRVKNATPSGIIPTGNANANIHSSHSGHARTLRVPRKSMPKVRRDDRALVLPKHPLLSIIPSRAAGEGSLSGRYHTFIEGPSVVCATQDDTALPFKPNSTSTPKRHLFCLRDSVGGIRPRLLSHAHRNQRKDVGDNIFGRTRLKPAFAMRPDHRDYAGSDREAVARSRLFPPHRQFRAGLTKARRRRASERRRPIPFPSPRWHVSASVGGIGLPDRR